MLAPRERTLEIQARRFRQGWFALMDSANAMWPMSRMLTGCEVRPTYRMDVGSSLALRVYMVYMSRHPFHFLEAGELEEHAVAGVAVGLDFLELESAFALEALLTVVGEAVEEGHDLLFVWGAEFDFDAGHRLEELEDKMAKKESKAYSPRESKAPGVEFEVRVVVHIMPGLRWRCSSRWKVTREYPQ
jgi:hypothetical protein